MRDYSPVSREPWSLTSEKTSWRSVKPPPGQSSARFMNVERAHSSSRLLERLAQPVFFAVPRSLAPANSLFPPRQKTS